MSDVSSWLKSGFAFLAGVWYLVLLLLTLFTWLRWCLPAFSNVKLLFFPLWLISNLCEESFTLCKYPTTYDSCLKQFCWWPNSDFLTPLFIYKEGFPLSLAYLFISVYFYVFLTSPHHFEHFLTFWYKEIFQGHPVLSLCWTWNQPLPPHGVWYLETKNRALDTVILPSISLLLGSLSRCKETCIHTHSCTYSHTPVY